MVTNSLPKAIQDCHKLMIWIIPLLDDFPRNRRFSLGKRLEDGLIEVLETWSRQLTPQPNTSC